MAPKSSLPKKHGEKIKADRIFRAHSSESYEKRRSERILVVHQFYSLILAVTEKSGAVSTIEGWATDLSEHGLGACCDAYLPKNEEIGVEIVGEFGPGLLRARVAWCNKLPSTGRIIKKKYFQWRIGLEFLFKNSDDRALISNIIKRM